MTTDTLPIAIEQYIASVYGAPDPADASLSTLDIGLACRRAGISVIPIKSDGSKSPKCFWSPFQEQLPTEEQMRFWWRPLEPDELDDVGKHHWARPWGIAAVAGAVSGNLMLFDFDFNSGVNFPKWLAAVEARLPGVANKFCFHRTPSGRIHVWFRCDSPVPKNTRLAVHDVPDAEGKLPVMIETRGEGGQALIPGSPGACHKTGRTYDHIGGWKLQNIHLASLVTKAELEVLFAISAESDKTGIEEKRKLKKAFEAEVAARAAELATHPADCDCRHHAKAKAGPHGHACGAGALRPGDDYDRRGPEWKDILEPAGWRLDHSVGGVDHWTRPGKREGVSATTGHARTPDNLPLLYVFSSNAHPFDSETSYSKFSAYTTLHHGGDFSAAARALASLGYGSGFTDEFADIDVSNFDFVAAAQNDTRTPAERAADLWAQSAFVAGDAAAADAAASTAEAAGAIRDPLSPAMTNSPEPPPPPGPDTTCVRPHGVHLERLRDCVWMYIWVDCGRPSCPGCAIKWKMLRRQHIRRHAGEIAEANPLATMFVFNAAGKAKWKTIHKHLNRQFLSHERDGRADLHGFARLDMNGDNYYLGVSTVHPGPSATNVVEMKPELAAERMCGAIDAMPLIDKAHAYTTSRNWPVIPDGERDRKSEWRRISRITTAAPVVHEILTARGANIKFVASRENKIKTHFGYLFDPAVCNVSSEHLAAEVSLGELLPEDEVEAVNGSQGAAPRDTLDVLGWGESARAFAGGVTLNASGDVTVF